MKVYVVQKHIVGPMHIFDIDTDDALYSNGKILGVFKNEDDAKNYLMAERNKDIAEYLNYDYTEDDISDFDMVFQYEINEQDLV